MISMKIQWVAYLNKILHVWKECSSLDMGHSERLQEGSDRVILSGTWAALKLFNYAGVRRSLFLSLLPSEYLNIVNFRRCTRRSGPLCSTLWNVVNFHALVAEVKASSTYIGTTEVVITDSIFI